MNDDSAAQVVTEAPAAPESPAQVEQAAKATKPAKKAGRPKGSGTAAKRKPGRPKGSKNQVRRPKRAGTITADTISQLEQELEQKRAAYIQMKQDERADLQARLDEVDAELVGLTGTAAPKRAPKRRARKSSRAKTAGQRKVGRPKGSKNKPKKRAKKAGGSTMTLADSIGKVLGTKKKGMAIKDIAAAVPAAGYATKSSNLYPMVAQALRKSDRFVKIGRGVYASK